MSEQLAELKDKLCEIEAVFSLPAWQPSDMPRNRSCGIRRQEDAIVRVADIRLRIASIQAGINSYIDVLRAVPDSQIRDRTRKVRLLEMRYLGRKDWKAIAAELYGGDLKTQNADMRKSHRLHDAACRDIWRFWEHRKSSTSVPSISYNEAVTKP